MQRLLVAPMRSKFVPEPPTGPDAEEHTFRMDPELSSKFPLWRSALLDVLMERFNPRALERPPPGMRQWGQGVATDANPLADWMEERVQVTGNKEDFVLLADLVAVYKADEQLRRRMPPVDFKRLAKAYLGTVALSFKEAAENIKLSDGTWTSKRNVARGVQRVAASA
jgi:hypothetical protein